MPARATALLSVGVLFGALTACGPRDPGTRLNAQQTLLYEGDALGYPARIQALADGRLAVLEAYGNAGWVKFFSAAGDYLGAAVPTGPGPREMLGAWDFVPGPDDSLRVLDVAGRTLVTVTDSGVTGTRDLPEGAIIRLLLRPGELLGIDWLTDAAFVRYGADTIPVGKAPGTPAVRVFHRQQAYDGPWLIVGDTLLVRAHLFAPRLEFWNLTTNSLVRTAQADDHDWEPFTDAEDPLPERRGYSGLAVLGDRLYGLSGWGMEMPEARRLEVFDLASGAYLHRISLGVPVVGLTADAHRLYALVYEPWPGIVSIEPEGAP